MDIRQSKFMQYIQSWLEADEIEAFIESMQNASPVRGVRLNTLKMDAEGFKSFFREAIKANSPYCEESFIMQDDFSYGKHPFHHAGLFYIQEPSASIVGSITKDYLGENVLDLCAAPGGKSTQIAQYLPKNGLLISNEIDYGRAKILSSNIERMGIENCVVTCHRPVEICEIFGEYFDNIIVDAPCSGEGMMRKNEQAIFNWNIENVHTCAQRQLHILESAYSALKSGGYITYSTCTFNTIENENVILAFLKKHPDLCTVPPKIALEGYADRGYYGLDDAVRVFPHKHVGEGHFICVIKKNEREHRKAIQWKYRESEQLESYKKKVRNLLEILFHDTNCFIDANFRNNNGSIIYTNFNLPRGLKIVKEGINIASILPSQILIPHHNIATTAKSKNVRNTYNFSLDSLDIYRYLHGEELTMSDSKFQGWGIATIENHPIGLIKAVQSNFKNHYPKGLRNLK